MILPGMNYQDASWGKIKAAVSLASTSAINEVGVMRITQEPISDEIRFTLWIATEERLRRPSIHAYLEKKVFNHSGRSGYELALELAEGLCSFIDGSDGPKYFRMLAKKLGACKATDDTHLKKVVGDVLSGVRDAIDIQGFQAATGEPISEYKLLGLRWVEKWATEVSHIIQNWQAQPEYAALILGRERISAEPIEARMLKNGQRCQAKWLLNWSDHYGRFHDGETGPIHRINNKKFTRTEENIEDLLWELDPHHGRYADMPKLVNVEMEAVERALERTRRQVTDDDHHESRIQPPPVSSETPPPDLSDPDDEVPVDFDMADEAQFDAFLHEDENNSASPGRDQENATSCRSDIPNLPTSEKSDDENLLARSNCLDIFPLPIQVGIMRDLTTTRHHSWLIDLLDTLDVFNQWQLPRSIDRLTDTELAKRLGDLEQQSISPYLFKKRLKQARQVFLECAARHLSMPTQSTEA